MAVWLIRAGKHGEYEAKFLQEGRLYVTWHSLDVDLAALDDRAVVGNRDVRPDAGGDGRAGEDLRADTDGGFAGAFSGD